jgi:hypothetical protein
VAGDPSRSRSGGDTRWITGHMLAAQPSWVRGEPTIFGETASFLERAYVVDIKKSARGAVRSSDPQTQSTVIPSRHPGFDRIISTYSVADLALLWACAAPSGSVRTGKRQTLIGRAQQHSAFALGSAPLGAIKSFEQAGLDSLEGIATLSWLAHLMTRH